MKSFKHVNAKTKSKASKLLKQYGSKAKVIAGGTDLLGVLKDRILPDYPEVIINIKTIPALDYIKEDSRGLKIGALAKLNDIVKSPLVQEKYKLLAEAASAVATPQIRKIGTIGGNLCQDVRCWYYRYPHSVGGRIFCYLKGGKSCYALMGENQYHSIFGASRAASPPCSLDCPGSVDIPSYLSKFREGDLHDAAKTLLNTNPLPSITGRVCPHFCEQECNRSELDEPVSIRDIERFMGDYILDKAEDIIKPPEVDTGRSVAIIGSGPAGLSAAYYLSTSGHYVTVFDRMEEPGGMLAYGIPAYRLPKDVVRRQVEAIKNMGIEFKTKANVGKDVTLEGLKNDFDSVFIACGAWSQPSIGLKGEVLTKSGLEFLTNVNRGVKEVPGKRVLVIGGGNVALDVAITASRLGAEDVTLACLECREEMPAFEEEINQAIEEGVKLMPSWGPSRVLASNGKVNGMELVRCTSVFDQECRFAPTYDHSVTEVVAADQIIMAVGQTADLSFIDPKRSLNVEGGLIAVDPETQTTGIPGLFAGGDVTSGPATIIQAIASGKRAAAGIDLFLRGEAPQAEDRDRSRVKPFLKFNSDYLKETDRIKAPKTPISKRTIDDEDAPGLGLREIENEANRCFNCGCLAVNASDIAVVLLALNAKIKISGSGGVRTVSIDDFFHPLGNLLKADEVVTEIRIPRPKPSAKQTFLKFRLRKAVDFPIVSVASIIHMRDGVCKDARIVLGAVAQTPIRAWEAERAIKRKAISIETAEAAAEAATRDTLALDKNAHKVEITKALVKKALLS